MSSSVPQPDGKKRQRVSLACLACRHKRMRCDGQQPICGSCTSRGTECKFQHAENKRRPPSKKYVESLQARIRHLEAQVISLGSKPADTSANLDLAPDFEEEDDATGADEEGPLSDLAGLVGRLNVIDDGQVHYFGSQSSYNLVQEPLSETDPHEPSLKAQMQGLVAAAQLGKTVNVTDELQNHLLDLYWRWQNPWNYVIHKGVFLRSFRGEDDGKYCSPLLLCSIFAIAARYSDRPELRSVPDDASTAGDAFCEHAKVLMLYEAEAPSITTVQAACLLALRIMSDGKEALGWLYAGNATRMAHNLGLHLDSSKWTTTALVPEEDAEARKVTWWGCYVVDKLFSVGLGRPSSTPKSTISCLKPSIDTNEEFTPWLPTSDASSPETMLGMHSHISSTACHVSETYTIACEAMDIIYAANSKLSTRQLEDVISKADVELRTHFRELPSHLRLPASPKVPMLPHICLFHIQYHAHLILLHRPLIRNKGRRSSTSVETSADDGSSKGDDYENRHMAICCNSAAEIARLLRTYKQQYTLVRSVPPKNSILLHQHHCDSRVLRQLMCSLCSTAPNPHRSSAPVFCRRRGPSHRRPAVESQQVAGNQASPDVRRCAAGPPDGMVHVERPGAEGCAAVGAGVVSV
ncbi:hypothetical protein FJTKL_06300 [Diaporthe vaccinii]|uniref:Zn(2)-C6 fungal-type domain-containing protein n=1 Tax=Diaporthe vaccinii TaxID=105482 RepID=A0ABR4DQJ0_9PEZI